MTRASMAPQQQLATSSTARRPPDDIFDAPTWRDVDAEASLGDRIGSEVSSATLRLPADDGSRDGPRLPIATPDASGRDRSTRRLRKPGASGRDSSSGSIPLPDDAAGRGASGSIPLPDDGHQGSSGPVTLPDDAARWGSSGSIALPDDAERRGTSGPIRLPDDAARRGTSGPIRLPDDAGRRGSSGSIQLLDDAARRGTSGPIRLPDDAARRAASGSIPLPDDAAGRGQGQGMSGPITRPGEDRRGRHSSSPGMRRPTDTADAGGGLVVRRVSPSRPAPVRQVAQVDSPQSHDVKALIAQRLKLLDHGADHFQLLGVAQDVAPDALRKAYFALARQLHPDRLAALGIADDGRHAQRLFAQINAGFAILSEHGRRSQYLDVLRRGGEAAIRAEQARAEEMTRRILEAEEAYRRGELALRRDQPGTAVAELERAIQLNADEADYHAALAWARFCAAPDKQAIAVATRSALERAVQRAPRSVTARFYLGRVERMLGRDQDALRQFRDVLAAAPGHAEAASEVRAIEARLGGGDKPGGGFGRPRR